MRCRTGPVDWRAIAMSMPFAGPPVGLEVTSGAGAVISLVVVSLLFVVWLIALVALLVDSISVGAKIIWFVALTCLAPVAIPIYAVLRHRRHRAHPGVEGSIA
jgi:hypothetical protein